MDRGGEMEFALSQVVASGGAFEHRTSEGGHGVQDFLAELYLGDRPGEAVGLESGADDGSSNGRSPFSIRLGRLYPLRT